MLSFLFQLRSSVCTSFQSATFNPAEARAVRSVLTAERTAPPAPAPPSSPRSSARSPPTRERKSGNRSCNDLQRPPEGSQSQQTGES